MATLLEKLEEGKKVKTTPQKPQKKKRGIGSQIADFVQSAGAHGVSAFAEGVGGLAKVTDYVNPVSWLAKAMGKEDQTFGLQTQKGAQFLAKQPLEVQEKLRPKESLESAGGKAGAFTGEVSGQIAAQVIPIAGGARAVQGLSKIPLLQALSQAAPKTSQAVGFLGRSAGTTAALTATERGELPSAKEVAGYGLFDVLLGGVGGVGKNIYRKAFKGTKAQERRLVEQFGQTVADVAEKLGYSGTPASIVKQAEKESRTIWGDLIKIAQKEGKPVTRSKFSKIADKLVKQFDDLPESELKKEVQEGIREVVMKYAPKKAASPKEIIGIIKNINKELFSTGSFVLTPKQASSLVNNLKRELKQELPDAVRGKYTDYALNQLVKKVMQDKEVSRLVLRTQLGALTGAGAAISSGIQQGQSPGDILKNALLYGIIGGSLSRASGQPLLLTKGGKTLQSVGTPQTSQIIKNVIKYLRQQMSPQSEQMQ